MDIRLIVTGGKANKRELPLVLPATIGRSREAGLTIGHPMVSRRHCELSEAQGRVRIRDLGSLNGTVISGKRVAEATLQPDEEFTVGPLTFRVQYTPASPSEPAADAPTTECLVSPVAVREQPPGAEATVDDGVEETLSLPDDDGAAEPEAGRAPKQRLAGGIAPPDGRLPDFSSFAEPEPDPAATPSDEPTEDEQEPAPQEDSALRRFFRDRP